MGLCLLLGSTTAFAAADSGQSFDTSVALAKLRELKKKTTGDVRANIDDLKEKNKAAEKDVQEHLQKAAEDIEVHMNVTAGEADLLIKDLHGMTEKFKKDIRVATDINEKLMKDMESFKNLLRDARGKGEEYYKSVKQEVEGYVKDYMKVFEDSQEDVKNHIDEIMRILDESN